MIQPTVGRVVWFYESLAAAQDDQPQAAIVTYVHHDRSVNLMVMTSEGDTVPCQRVTLAQDDDVPSAARPFAQWMPYQVVQAKKHEEPPINFAERIQKLEQLVSDLVAQLGAKEKTPETTKEETAPEATKLPPATAKQVTK